METQIDTTVVDDTEIHDTLSLRDLQITTTISAINSVRSTPRTSTSDQFEFFSTTIDNFALTKTTSFSFRNPDRHSLSNHRVHSASPVKFSTSVKKVNITSLTTMSAKSRRRMFMFGPVKFKPEMELSALRERQGRRGPLPMFPVVEDDGGKEKCSHNSHWGIVRNLKCRAQRDHLSAVLAKSLGCITNY